ncbi:protein kinase [Actinomadura sp. 21ATH]|uniref:serine/threonine-protein kinase n=1 Tax=Actinomadura sp. 21ATH TaxID=1735444 RepID=UPI0035BF99FC
MVRRLGAGGMGVVYLARGPDGVPVAVKVMHSAWVAEPGFPLRFEREVEAIRRVAPFCTAPVLDAAVTDEAAYIVTEYVEGRTLWDTVKAGGPLAGARLESVAVGTALALTAVHRAGIVHRDLKPGNVILSPEGTRVIDFGVAKLAGSTPITGNVAIGTPAFMAPEQARGEEVTPAADVFSWGAVVAFAATGQPPFGRVTGPEVFYRLLHEEPDLGGVPERLAALVARAMDKDPDRRPAARDLIDELTGHPVGDAEAAGLTRTRRPAPAPSEVTEGTEAAKGEGRAPETARAAEPVTEPGPSAVRRRPFRRGTVALAALATAAGALTAYAVFQVLDAASRAGGAAFHDGFGKTGDWPRQETPLGTARYHQNGYLLQLLPEQGMAATAPVDAVRMRGVRVATAARMQTGGGQYGVWCGGNPVADAQNRYSFTITTTGEAGIVKEARGGARHDLVPLAAVADVDAGGENRIEAECRFENGRTRLRMLVNGRQVAAYDDVAAPYGPGAVGVAASAQAGSTVAATARYEWFSARRLPAPR